MRTFRRHVLVLGKFKGFYFSHICSKFVVIFTRKNILIAVNPIDTNERVAIKVPSEWLPHGDGG